MREVKFTEKRWDGSTSRWTDEDLLACIPKAMARYAKSRATPPVKADMHLAYREPGSHTVNINAIQKALEEIEGLKGPSAADKASARSELQAALSESQEAHAPVYQPQVGSKLRSLNTAFFASIAAPEPLLAPEPPAPMPQAQQNIMQDPAILRALDYLVRQNGDPGYHEIDRVASLDPEIKFNGMDAAMAMPEIGLPPIPLSQGEFADFGEFAAAKDKGVRGVVDRDFGALPDYQALGVERPAGNATEDELAFFEGATKLDGTPLEPSDIFSVGAMLVSSDIISQMMCFIPPLELGRLGDILKTRMIKSDQDHSRRVMTGNFSIVKPMIGFDPNARLHVDHPLLGKAPLTGLMARLLFPKVSSDANQMAAVESVMMGKLQNLSIAFGHGGITCALCGEMPILSAIKAQSKVIGFVIPPETNLELCKMGDMTGSYSWDQPMATLRTPAATEGGFLYRNVRIINAGEDGTIQIEPQPMDAIALTKGSVLMTNMNYGWFSWGLTCKFHGRTGSFAQDGRRVVGMFTNLRAFLNTAIVDKGADPNAKLVLSPTLKY